MPPDLQRVLCIGITGQSGFIGTHLLNTLSLWKDRFTIIPFEDSFFKDAIKLTGFVKKCDFIVHLAGVNRHSDQQQVYLQNIQITKKLIDALDAAHTNPSIIFSSSIQESRGNLYGNAKKESRELLASWCERNNASFTGLLIPNVFGPFGAPFYNSVIATFSHQIANGLVPVVEVDAELNLIYVGELVEIIVQVIETPPSGINQYHAVEATKSITVGEILKMLFVMKEQYIDFGQIPDITDRFSLQLFNTLRSYLNPSKFFPFAYKVNSDSRGIFIETMKTISGGQSSYSTTFPGITRGNHFHTRKVERFSVLKGEALIQMRKIGSSEVCSFNVSGDTPSFVDMPVWYTHNITNIGSEELITLFWINEIYDPNDTDTFYENVNK